MRNLNIKKLKNFNINLDNMIEYNSSLDKYRVTTGGLECQIALLTNMGMSFCEIIEDAENDSNVKSKVSIMKKIEGTGEALYDEMWKYRGQKYDDQFSKLKQTESGDLLLTGFRAARFNLKNKLKLENPKPEIRNQKQQKESNPRKEIKNEVPLYYRELRADGNLEQYEGKEEVPQIPELSNSQKSSTNSKCDKDFTEEKLKVVAQMKEATKEEKKTEQSGLKQEVQLKEEFSEQDNQNTAQENLVPEQKSPKRTREKFNLVIQNESKNNKSSIFPKFSMLQRFDYTFPKFSFPKFPFKQMKESFKQMTIEIDKKINESCKCCKKCCSIL